MSAGASRVMPEEELKAVVAQKMPAFSQERDCQQLIHDFYAKYGDSSKPMSQAVIASMPRQRSPPRRMP